MTKINNLIGKKFGKLLVVSRDTNNKYDKAMWFCICDCQPQYVLPKSICGSSLVNKTSTSCSCSRKEKLSKQKGISRPKKIKSPYTDTSWNTAYYEYKFSAEKKRNIEFSLSFDEFKSICLENCAYCGVEPRTRFSKYLDKKLNLRKHGTVDLEHALKTIIYRNGIDRVDNDIGYITNNCVACCTICNRAKSDLSIEEWLEYIKRLSNFQTKNII